MDMKLSQLEIHSALWKKLTDHWAERLSMLRLKNDNELDTIETARLRGRIAAYKDFLAMGDPETKVTDTAATRG